MVDAVHDDEKVITKVINFRVVNLGTDAVLDGKVMEVETLLQEFTIFVRCLRNIYPE